MKEIWLVLSYRINNDNIELFECEEQFDMKEQAKEYAEKLCKSRCIKIIIAKITGEVELGEPSLIWDEQIEQAKIPIKPG